MSQQNAGAATLDAVSVVRAHRNVLSREAMHRGRFLRLAANGMMCLVCATWIGWWVVPWFATLVWFDYVATPWATARFVTPFTQNDPKRSEIRSAAIRVISSGIYALAWSSAWAIGGAEAAFFAGVTMCSAFFYSLVYYSHSRWMFLATVGPQVAISAMLQLVYQPAAFLPMMILPTLLILTLRTVWGRNDQIMLFEALDKSFADRKVAEEASVAKSQFLATMSHELRTPLNAVIGYAEILEEDLGAEGRATAASDAARIRRAARDLLNLINEVLDLSKIEAGRMELAPERTNIPQVVADVVETTAHIAEANNVRVTVDLAPRVNELILDAGKLRQCLLNLVSNACKFTKDGDITIAVTLDDSNGGPQLKMIVADTGIGIAPDQAARLFEPFVQADGSHTRRHGGTGLGLVITRRLARLMGGDVEMSSVEGEGSRFTLTLAAQWPAALNQTEKVGAESGPIVLVIEDETTARDLARRALARMPLNVVCATTGEEGMRLAAALKPALIVLDIHLPDRLGWDMLAEFKADAELRETPVLVVSIDDDRARALSLGACDHLVKPVDRDRLAASVLRFVRLPALAPAPQPARIEAA